MVYMFFRRLLSSFTQDSYLNFHLLSKVFFVAKMITPRSYTK